MIELNVYQDNRQTSEFYKKWYARASYKETIDLNGLAKLLKVHNTNWSEGALVGPNPCNNTLQVQCPLDNAQLLLYDMYGKMVLSVPADGEVTSLDMSQLAAGLYLLNVSKDNSVVKSVKVVRQ